MCHYGTCYDVQKVLEQSTLKQNRSQSKRTSVMKSNKFAFVKFRGDPLFLEPFWVKHAAKSAVLISGWHRMSYSFGENNMISPEQYNTISRELEVHIRELHTLARNAITKGKYIIFGVGSTQLLGAAVYALSMNLSSPASVVAAIPSYPVGTKLINQQPLAFCQLHV